MTALPTNQALSDANLDSLERLAIALGLFFAKHTGSLPDTSPSFEAVSFQIKESSTTLPEEITNFNNTTDANLKLAEYPPEQGAFLETATSSVPGMTATNYRVTRPKHTSINATIQFTCSKSVCPFIPLLP